MELIISILCLLLGGAYCEDGGAGGAAQPTAVPTAVVQALITPTPQATLVQDPYTPLDPNCNFNDFYALAPLVGISHVSGSSHARTCWLAENYDRFYLNILHGCPACDRAAYYRVHGRYPPPGEGYYYLDGEWVDADRVLRHVYAGGGAPGPLPRCSGTVCRPQSGGPRRAWCGPCVLSPGGYAARRGTCSQHGLPGRLGAPSPQPVYGPLAARPVDPALAADPAGPRAGA